MHMALKSPTPVRLVLSVALLGAAFYSPTRATPTAPIPLGYLGRNFSLCEGPAPGTSAAVVASAPVAARLKMIREKDQDGDHPRNDASAPLPPVALASASSIEPRRLPRGRRPHLRC